MTPAEKIHQQGKPKEIATRKMVGGGEGFEGLGQTPSGWSIDAGLKTEKQSPLPETLTVSGKSLVWIEKLLESGYK